MILTNCAACAAPLAHDAPRCVRCWTRYCSAACLNNHAHRGGHSEEICAERERAGGAEQYHANRKCTEAVAVAVAKCAADTEDQTCYICLEGGSEEGLVASRILGESRELTLKIRWIYGQALYMDPDATLDNLREAVSTLEDTERIARRVLGGAHPTAAGIERDLENARETL